jgi:polyhydroxybutyrate depolymerase
MRWRAHAYGDSVRRVAARVPPPTALHRRVLAWITILFLVVIANEARAGTFVEDRTLEHAGVMRFYDAYLPDGLAPGAPLMIAFHGGTLSNESLRGGASAELFRIADENGVLVLLPNGTDATGATGASGSFNWNDCRADAGPASTPADDVGFVSALIDVAIRDHAIDPTRVYALGASNGGLMTYRLLFELSDRIAAGAAAIANLPANSECRAAPAEPRSVLVMNGTADPIMPFAGGNVAANRGAIVSSDATRDFWRDFLGTATGPQVLDYPDLDPNDGGTVRREIYAGGRGDTEIRYYRVLGGGHNLPSIAYPQGTAQNHDIEAVTEIWSFLVAQHLGAGEPPRAGVQIQPGGGRVLVNKDVGAERWAIIRDEADGSVTGNVFIQGETTPRFVFCREIATNPSSAEITYDCRGAADCVAAPCDPAAWTPLGEVRIPATFFFPPF